MLDIVFWWVGYVVCVGGAIVGTGALEALREAIR